MRNGPDRIWSELKSRARVLAGSPAPLPSFEECAVEIERITNDVLGSPGAISAEAIQFYSAELCAMVEELRKQ